MTVVQKAKEESPADQGQHVGLPNAGFHQLVCNVRQQPKHLVEEIVGTIGFSVQFQAAPDLAAKRAWLPHRFPPDTVRPEEGLCGKSRLVRPKAGPARRSPGRLARRGFRAPASVPRISRSCCRASLASFARSTTYNSGCPWLSPPRRADCLPFRRGARQKIEIIDRLGRRRGIEQREALLRHAVRSQFTSQESFAGTWHRWSAIWDVYSGNVARLSGRPIVASSYVSILVNSVATAKPGRPASG